MPSHIPLVSYVSRTGTDATIAQHIQMIIDRGYVKERMEGNTKYLLPSKLGLGLVHGYDQIGLDKCLSKPQLRREVSGEMIFAVFHRLISPQTERGMVQVCQGTKTKNDMLVQALEQYKAMFIIAKREFNKISGASSRCQTLLLYG